MPGATTMQRCKDRRALAKKNPNMKRTTLRRYLAIQVFLVPALLAACAALLQYGPLDMDLARAFARPEGSSPPWHDSVWLDVIGHHTANALPILAALAATVAGAASFVLPFLRPWRAILFTSAAAIVVGPLLVDYLKTLTTQHCPSALVEFGGPVLYAQDRAAPFWTLSSSLAGHCLPSGHAAGGYALLSLYFAGWAAGRPAWRWRGLLIGIGTGVLFSVVRMLQGAHFASATMWSATIDWSVCALLFLPLICRHERREQV
jgi:membrane-associated PAP2 superfamily phosphatase